VHWTTESWVCPNCAVHVGQRHIDGCSLRATTSEPIWFGPPITPGMLPRRVVEGDVIAPYLKCVHCETDFEVDEVIFENRAQSLAIHGTCILVLAQMVPRELASPEEVEDEFERRRAEIFDGHR
jgi:hypothetical protein